MHPATDGASFDDGAVLKRALCDGAREASSKRRRTDSVPVCTDSDEYARLNVPDVDEEMLATQPMMPTQPARTGSGGGGGGGGGFGSTAGVGGQGDGIEEDSDSDNDLLPLTQTARSASQAHLDRVVALTGNTVDPRERFTRNRVREFAFNVETSLLNAPGVSLVLPKERGALEHLIGAVLCCALPCTVSRDSAFIPLRCAN